MATGTTSGTLGRYPLPRLLLFILRKGFTGAMELELPKGKVSTYFDNGWPEYTDLMSPPDLLGGILLEQGFITTSQHDASLVELANHQELHGRILVGLGFIDQKQLVSALCRQLHRKLVRLFEHEDAPFNLTLNRPPERLNPELQQVYADPIPVVLHGLRSHYTFERLNVEMPGLEGSAFKLQVDDRSLLERLPLEQGDEATLQLLQQSHWILDDLLAANQTARLPVTALVYALWAMGALDVKTAGQAPVRRPLTARRFTPKTTQELKAMAHRATSDPDARAVPDGPEAPTPRGSQAPTAVNLPELPPDASEQAAQIYAELQARLDAVAQQNLFEILGVPTSATRQQVKDAYLALAKKFHPDRVAALGLESVRGHTDRLFQRVSEAFTTLLDDAKRQEYLRIVKDKSLAGGRDRARQVLEAEVHFQKGEVYFRKGDLDNAEAMFRAAVAGNPDEGEHHALLAWTLYHKAQRSGSPVDLNEITKTLRKAIDLSPRCARAHHFLGKILQSQGLPDEALRCFEKAVEIKPNYLEPAREVNVIKMRKAKTAKDPKPGFWDRFKRK